MNIEVEAALQDLYEVLEWSEPTHPENAQEAVEKKAVMAYGDARELKGHVDACGAYQPVHPNAPESGPACGDGWLCDAAKGIEARR